MPRATKSKAKSKKLDPESDPSLQPKVLIEKMSTSDPSESSNDTDDSTQISQTFTPSDDSLESTKCTTPDSDSDSSTGTVIVKSEPKNCDIDSKYRITTKETVKDEPQGSAHQAKTKKRKNKEPKKAVAQKTSSTAPKKETVKSKKSLKDKPLQSVHGMSLRSKNDLRLIASASDTNLLNKKRKAPKKHSAKAGSKKSRK